MTTTQDKTDQVESDEVRNIVISRVELLIRAMLIYLGIRAIGQYAFRPYVLLVVLSVVGAAVSIFFIKAYLVYFLIFATLPFYYLLRITLNTRQALGKEKPSSLNSSDFSKGPRRSLAEFERVLATVFEVVIGLAIFEASLGILSPNFNRGWITITSPLHVIAAYPIVFLMYVVFIITSVQYLMGGISHFHGEIPSISKGTSFFNFLLLIGQAITILGMALSIVDRDIVMFSIWYIGLIVMDIVWLGTLVTPIHHIQYTFDSIVTTFGKNIIATSKESTSKTNTINPELNIRRTIYEYWLNGNFSYFAFLLVAEPLVYVKPTGVQYYEIAVAIELFAMTILSTFYANIKCLELLQQ